MARKRAKKTQDAQRPGNRYEIQAGSAGAKNTAGGVQVKHVGPRPGGASAGKGKKGKSMKVGLNNRPLKKAGGGILGLPKLPI